MAGCIITTQVALAPLPIICVPFFLLHPLLSNHVYAGVDATAFMDSMRGGLLLVVVLGGLLLGLLSVQAYYYLRSRCLNLRRFRVLIIMLWTLQTAQFLLSVATLNSCLQDDQCNDRDSRLIPDASTAEAQIYFALSTLLAARCCFFAKIRRASESSWLSPALLLGLTFCSFILLAVSATAINLGLGVDASIIRWLQCLGSILGLGADLYTALFIYLAGVVKGEIESKATPRAVSRITKCWPIFVNTGLLTCFLDIGVIVSYIFKPDGYTFVALLMLIPPVHINSFIASLRADAGPSHPSLLALKINTAGLKVAAVLCLKNPLQWCKGNKSSAEQIGTSKPIQVFVQVHETKVEAMESPTDEVNKWSEIYLSYIEARIALDNTAGA